jgi:hypothetical protein
MPRDAEMVRRKPCLIREPGITMVCEQEGHGDVEYTAYFATFQAPRRVLKVEKKNSGGASKFSEAFGSGIDWE